MNKYLKHALILIIFLVGAVLTSFYSMDHYADGGCDGGTCTILLIGHAFPLLIVWGLLYFAFLLAISKRKGTFVFIGLGLILNSLVMFTDLESTDELYTEPIILYLIAFICLALYFGGEQLGIVPSKDERTRKQSSTLSIVWHCVLTTFAALRLYFSGQLIYFLSSTNIVIDNVSKLILEGIPLDLIYFATIIALFKKKRWAYPTFALLLLYAIVRILINGFELQWPLQALLLLTLNMVTLIMLLFFYFKEIASKKTIPKNPHRSE